MMPFRIKTSIAILLISVCISTPLLAEMDVSDDAVYKELKEMAAHGNPEAQLMLGDWHFNGEYVRKDTTKAAQLYEAAAKQGLKRAQCITGGLYFLGKGVKKDHQVARFWLEKAANQGFEEAKLLLASMDRMRKTSRQSGAVLATKKPVTMSLNAMAK